MKFYKETELQETEAGIIPRDWKVLSIKDAFELYKGTTPSTKKSKYWGGDIPFITPTDITAVNNLSKIYLTETEKHLTKEGLQSKNLRIVPKGSLLFTSRATIGYLAINNSEAAINQGVIALIPKRNDMNVPYYYYYLTHIRKKLEELAGGSTYREISMTTFSKVTIPYPSLNEQSRIAEILLTIDRTIGDVDNVIVKLEGLKKALMNDLLAGRIRIKEEHGKFIFHRETEFQRTEIGEIPKDWKIMKIEEVAEIRGNKKLSKDIREVVFIPMEAIPDNKIYASFEIRDSSDVKSYVYCEPGDILLAKITPSFENGKQGIVPSDILGDFALATTEVYPLNCKHIDALYLFYLLKYPPNRNKLASLMRGTTGRRRVPRDALEKLIIPFPPIDEQKKIADILLTIDETIELYHEERNILESLKKGLMDILLTGKVRVEED
jgi:type I restriction enzyme S subunit